MGGGKPRGPDKEPPETGRGEGVHVELGVEGRGSSGVHLGLQ